MKLELAYLNTAYSRETTQTPYSILKLKLFPLGYNSEYRIILFLLNYLTVKQSWVALAS